MGGGACEALPHKGGGGEVTRNSFSHAEGGGGSTKRSGVVFMQ